MIILKRLIPYISSILLGALLLAGIHQPMQWLSFGMALIILPVLTILSLHQPQWRLEYLGLSIVPLVLSLAAYTFILIQENPLIIYVVIAATVILHFLFIKHITVFLYQPKKYIPYSLEYISTYCNIVASFYMYVSIFMFFILGISRLRYLMLMAIVGTVLLVWQTFWIQKIAWQRAKWFVLLITLVMTEGVWVLHFWPISFLVSGCILTVALYNVLHLSRYYLTNALTSQLLRRYLVTSGIVVFILLFTARWFI